MEDPIVMDACDPGLSLAGAHRVDEMLQNPEL